MRPGHLYLIVSNSIMVACEMESMYIVRDYLARIFD